MDERALFGRYWAAESPIHRLDPRTKLLGSLAVLAIVFCAQGWPALGLCALFILGCYGLARIPLGQAFGSVAPLAFIVVITALLNVLFVQGGQVYATLGPLVISEAGLRSAAFLAVRLLLLLMAMGLLTLTTETLDITEAFERLLAPLKRVGVPVHELAMIMGIALRFLPQFALELRIIYRAQISRGARFAKNPFKGGAASLTSLLIPLFASAFRHAETLSAAMDARCYHGDEGRTRLHPLAFALRDAIAAAVLAAFLVCVVLFNRLF